MNDFALGNRMKELGISNKKMYTYLNISRSAWYRKRKGITEFTLGEISAMLSILKLKTADGIFFSK